MTGNRPILPKWWQRLLGWLEHPLPTHPQIRQLTLLLALVFFIGGIYWSLQRNPDLLADISVWHVLLVFAVGVPFTVFLNALRMQLAAHLLNQVMPFSRAYEITILSMAANLLPLPGGVLVRVAAFKSSETNYRQSVTVNLLLALLWMAVVIVYAGGAMLLLHAGIVTSIIFAGGIVLTVACLMLLYRQYGNASVSTMLLLLQFGMTSIDAARLWLCMGAISIVVSYLQMAVLTIASVTGSVISIVPAGLGVREWTAALLSPMIGITPEAGFMATSLNRIIGLTAIAILAALLMIYRRSANND